MAVDGMGGVETALGRIDHFAFRHDLGATGMEMAAGRRDQPGTASPLEAESPPDGYPDL